MPSIWETLRSSVVARTPIFEILRVLRRHPEQGTEAEFYAMELPDWVNVVALTPEDEVVLVRQYRHGTDEITLEIPGGNVDAGESSQRAAERELREETGFAADQWEKIGTVEPNPAFMGNRCDTWLARGAERVGAPEPDEHEELEIELRDREAFYGALDDGEIAHALVVAAGYHLQRWEE